MDLHVDIWGICDECGTGQWFLGPELPVAIVGGVGISYDFGIGKSSEFSNDEKMA